MTKPSRNNGDRTGPVPPVEHQFKPGNPGRPKGSRNKLGEAFLQDLHANWLEHGIKTIEAVRIDKPDVYLRVVAGIIPTELNVKVGELDELTDDQLRQRLRGLTAALIAGGYIDHGRTDPARGAGQAGEVSTLQ